MAASPSIAGFDGVNVDVAGHSFDLRGDEGLPNNISASTTPIVFCAVTAGDRARARRRRAPRMS